MTDKKVPVILGTLLFAALLNAQTISVDMDTISGIQNEVSTSDSTKTLIIPLRISGAKDIFSYQCKFAFDTARFSFVGVEQDFGMTGEKNILTASGGSIIGIYQQQVNPPAPDTIELSASIQGTDATKKVSGDGLIGVVYLKSKMHPGDSAVFTVSNACVAEYEGALTAVASCLDGSFKVQPATAICPRKSISTVSCMRQVVVTFPTAGASFKIPEKIFTNANNLSIELFTPDGKLLTSRSILFNKSAGTSDRQPLHIAILNTFGANLYAGACVCRIKIGNSNFSQTVCIPK